MCQNLRALLKSPRLSVGILANSANSYFKYEKWIFHCMGKITTNMNKKSSYFAKDTKSYKLSYCSSSNCKHHHTNHRARPPSITQESLSVEHSLLETCSNLTRKWPWSWYDFHLDDHTYLGERNLDLMTFILKLYVCFTTQFSHLSSPSKGQGSYVHVTFNIKILFINLPIYSKSIGTHGILEQ